MEKRSGLETLSIPHICISGNTFLAATDRSAAGICTQSQCIDIEWPDMTVSIIVNVCPRPTEKCYIVFTGGQPFDKDGTLARRHFTRLTWKPIDAHVICVSDPIHFLPGPINLGFYAIDIFGPLNIPKILSKVLSLLKVSDTFLIGSSGGAWVTLKYLSEKLLPGVRKGLYICGQVNPMLSLTRGNCMIVISALNKDINWEINLSNLSDCNILCVQNEYDAHFFETQIKFYYKSLTEQGIKILLYNTPSSVVTDYHHGYGLPQPVLNGILKLLNNEPNTDVSEQADIERHRFRPYTGE
jgi:hypothetical protein